MKMQSPYSDDKIVQEQQDRLLDLRSQLRYLKKTQLTSSMLEKHYSSMPDLFDRTQPTTLVQPALGLFNEEDLKRIQKSFPYGKFSR